MREAAAVDDGTVWSVVDAVDRRDGASDGLQLSFAAQAGRL